MVPKAVLPLAPSHIIAKHSSFKGVLGLAQSCCEGVRSFLADAALLFHGLGSKAAACLGSKSFEAKVTSVKVGWGGVGSGGVDGALGVVSIVQLVARRLQEQRAQARFPLGSPCHLPKAGVQLSYQGGRALSGAPLPARQRCLCFHDFQATLMPNALVSKAF